jgi:O-antigen ligase
MRRLGSWDSAFVGEVLVLAITAPVFYFPSSFPQGAPSIALGCLALGWVWRRRQLGIWLPSTPALWPLVLLLAMAPVALWVAPPELRLQYSIPRATILLWNLCLFWTVLTHSARAPALAMVCLAGFALGGFVIAVLAPLGTTWLPNKIPVLRPLLERIPTPLKGQFAGAEGGFHPNQVAGTLLYLLPLLFAMTGVRLAGRFLPQSQVGRDACGKSWAGLDIGLLLCTAVIGTTFVFTQSRSGLFGLLAAVAVMALINWRVGRWLLVAGGIVLLASLSFFPAAVMNVVSDAPPEVTLGQTTTLEFRQKVWSQAVTAIHDFPLIGVGFGTFRRLMWLFYPLDINYTDDIAHVHNFFLQTALDFGLPGLVALIAIWLVAFAQTAFLWFHNDNPSLTGWPWTARTLAVGFLGCLVAQLIYSQLDAVAMGAKTNFMFWYLLALIFGVANLASHPY